MAKDEDCFATEQVLHVGQVRERDIWGYLYMCVSVNIYIYACIYIGIYMYTYIYVHLHMYIYMGVCA